MRLVRTFLAGAAIAALGLTLGARPAAAQNECLVGIQNQDTTTELSGTVECMDGDPACDADGAADGTCTFRIRACVDQPGVAGCELRPLKKIKVTTPGAPNIIQLTPTSGQISSVCSAFVDYKVGLKKKGKKPGKRKVVAMAKADVKPFGKNKDVDKILFQCDPPGTTTTTTGTTGTGCGPECPANPQGGPNELVLTVGATGNDLDTGYTGQSHNFINVQGSQLKYCLTGCDGTSDTLCDGSGATGNGTLNGPAFGAPLPLFSAGVAVCVVNRFQDPTIQTKVDVATGAFDAMATPLVLLSDTYQGTSNQVCPQCVAGKCDSGRNQGKSCSVDGTVNVNNPPTVNNVKYNVSRDCLPATANLLGTPKVVLPLTTDTSTLSGNANGNGFPCPGQTKHNECPSGGTCTVDCSAKPDPKGGINQTCCSTGAGLPCFPTANGGQIVRTGSTTVPAPASTYPKTSDGVMAAAFCIPATGGVTVDATAGLPGPGALLLAGQAQYCKAP